MAKWKAYGKYPGIFQDEGDPDHWRIVVNLGRAAKGEPRRRAVKVLHGKITEARAAHTELQGQRDKREIQPQATKAPKTVDEWFARWLETYKRRNVERSTFARYETYHKLYISPLIGAAKLRRLTAADVQDFYNALSDSGLAPGSIFQIVALLRQSLKKAIALGIVPRDPMTGADPPKRPGRRSLRVPSDDELRILLDTMSAADAAAYPLTRMALATGMREGELIALEWSSVDLKGGSVHVCRSAARVPGRDEGKRYYEYEFKSTKTGEARDVPLDPETLAWLKEHRKTVAAAKMVLRPKRWTDKDGDLVFPCLSVFAGTKAGRAWQADSLRKAFGRYTEKVGLGYMRFHDLRHAHGSLLRRRGVSLLTISRRLGHRSIKTTADTYGHVGEAESREAADTLADVWGAPAR